MSENYKGLLIHVSKKEHIQLKYNYIRFMEILQSTF